MKTSQNQRLQIEGILKTINKQLINKEEAMRLALLASIAGESIFFLGAPGTAKSLISRRLKSAFIGENNDEIKYFEYLMNQFSTPDEVFGPVSLKSLEQDEYKRITAGYLPNADIAFLDEIWKASPAIQNTLLTIINERKFHNGNQVVNVPLKALVAASNELPAQNQGLEALWDRFLIRMVVKPVETDQDFKQLICGDDVVADIEMDEKDLKNLISRKTLQEWKIAIDEIKVPTDVLNVILGIRKELALLNQEESRNINEHFYVSDRRWKKITHLLKASAFLNGRQQVDLIDCQIIEYCIWNTENQIYEAKEIVRKIVQQNGLNASTMIDDVYTAINRFNKKIDSDFYKVDKSKYREVRMKDGNMAYELAEKSKISIGSTRSVEVKYIYNEGRTVAVYDENKEQLMQSDYNGEFKIKNDTVSFLNTYHNIQNKLKIIIEKECLVKDNSIFSNKTVLAKLQEKADIEYEKIAAIIDKEYKKVIQLKEDRETYYTSNLFAGESMSDVISKTIAKSEIDLLKAKVDLDSAKQRYAK